MKILVVFTLSFFAIVNHGLSQFTLENRGNAFFAENVVVNSVGDIVVLPADIEDALFMPQISLIYNGDILLYNHRDTLFEYNLSTRSKREMLKPVEGTGCICGLAWSPDSSMVLVLAINTENYALQQFSNYLYIVSVSGVRPPVKYACAVNYSIPGLCESKPGKDFYFVDNTTVGYKVHLGSSIDAGKTKTVLLSAFK